MYIRSRCKILLCIRYLQVGDVEECVKVRWVGSHGPHRRLVPNVVAKAFVSVRRFCTHELHPLELVSIFVRKERRSCTHELHPLDLVYRAVLNGCRVLAPQAQDRSRAAL